MEAYPFPPLSAATPLAPSVDPVVPVSHVRDPSPGLPPAPPPGRCTPKASFYTNVGIEREDEGGEGPEVIEEN